MHVFRSFGIKIVIIDRLSLCMWLLYIVAFFVYIVLLFPRFYDE